MTVNLFVGPGWKEEGLSIRLAKKAGMNEEDAKFALSWMMMIVNFKFGRVLAGFENAIEIFIALDKDKQESFLVSLRDLGQKMGIEYMEDLANFLETSVAQADADLPRTELRFSIRFFN